MAGQVVEMDYPTMQSVAKGFRTVADTMNVIGKTMEKLFEALELALSFVGLGAYYGQCKEATKKKTKELVDHLNEFAKDIDEAVKDHKNGDFEGKSYFGGER
jgi:formylmethanofuran dehydrogenase subunit B